MLDPNFIILGLYVCVVKFFAVVTVDTKCDALCLTHSKPKSVASIGFPGALLSGSMPVSLT